VSKLLKNVISHAGQLRLVILPRVDAMSSSLWVSYGVCLVWLTGVWYSNIVTFIDHATTMMQLMVTHYNNS